MPDDDYEKVVTITEEYIFDRLVKLEAEVKDLRSEIRAITDRVIKLHNANIIHHGVYR
jgi:tRNA A-37 threonylcarbamoyl transferase component Bud32